jgi:hypothetical protein
MKTTELFEATARPKDRNKKILMDLITPETFAKHKEYVIERMAKWMSNLDVDEMVAKLSGSEPDDDDLAFRYELIKKALAEYKVHDGEMYEVPGLIGKYQIPGLELHHTPGKQGYFTFYIGYIRGKWEAEVWGNYTNDPRKRFATEDEAVAYVRKIIAKNIKKANADKGSKAV